MVQLVGRSIPHGGGPIDLFLIPVSASQLVYNKVRGICYPFGIVHIKDP